MKKNRQSVIIDDTKFNKSKMKDKNKSRMDEIPIKEGDYDKSNTLLSINGKILQSYS